MKVFLIKLLKQIAIILTIYIGTILLWFFIVKVFDINPYKLVKNKKIFILGNSHPQFGIADTLNIVNNAMAGETLFYEAIKARKILENNPDATICIDIDPENLKAAFINLADYRLPQSYRNYLYFMNSDEQKFIVYHNPLKAMRVFFSPNFIAPFRKVGSSYISEKFLDINHPQVEEAPKFSYKRVWEPEVEIQNFLAIENLIKDHPHNRFIITHLPKSKYWHFDFNDNYKHCMMLLEQLPNTVILDYTRVIFPDDHYADPEHLNYIGKYDMTNLLVNDLKKRNLITTN